MDTSQNPFAYLNDLAAPKAIAQPKRETEQPNPFAYLGELSKPKKAFASNTDMMASLAEEEGAGHLLPFIGAVYGQESGSGANARTSIDGARGGMQIMPDTFKRFARPGESIDNPVDNMRVGIRYIKSLGDRFGNDPARMGVGYFSGEGNVNGGEGSAWKNDRKDGNGKSVSGYVSDVLGRLSPVKSAQAATPDLSKAPTWKEVEANPDFQGLSGQEKYQAKQAYFDYWVAPHAGSERDRLRSEFVGEGPRTERTWGEAFSDTGAQLVEGGYNILGAIPNLIAPEGSVAKFANEGAESWRGKQSDVIKDRTEAASQKIDKAGEDGVMAQIGEAVSQYISDPSLAARFITTNLPSMIPGIGAAKVAQVAAIARGAKAARASQAATTAAGATNAVLNAGGARGDAFSDIKETLVKQGYTPEQAEQMALSDSRLVAAIGGATGYISGKIGLEKSLFGQGAGKGAIRSAITGAGAELAGEQLEEVAPQVATNYQTRQYDNRSLGKDVGRTIVETAIGTGPGAIVAGGAAAMNDGNEPSNGRPGEPPAPPAGNAPTNAHPTSVVADSIVGDLADAAGVPREFVLPQQDNGANAQPNSGAISDQDVLNYAEMRQRQLLAKLHGRTEQVQTDAGLVDREVPGQALTPQEQAEINVLESQDAAEIRSFYGVGQPAINGPQQNQPGIDAIQENQHAQDQTQAEPVGPTPSPVAVEPFGQPDGAAVESQQAAERQPAENPASLAGRDAGQQVQTEGSVTPSAAQAALDVSTRNDQQLRHLSTNGQPGWKEAAQAELAKRGIAAPAEPQGQFKSADEALAYIHTQRQRQGGKIPKALPLPYADGSFGLATEGQAGWEQAVAHAKATAPKTKKEARAKRAASKIRDLFKLALANKSGNKNFADIGKVSDSVAAKIASASGLDVSGYMHSIDESAIRHIIKEHGDESIETARGQVAITEDDIARIPEIISSPDEVLPGGKLADRNESIIFKKKIGDSYVYVQEVRDGRKKLSAKTLWKTRIAPPATAEAGEAHTSETFDRSNSTGQLSVADTAEKSKPKTEKEARARRAAKKSNQQEAQQNGIEAEKTVTPKSGQQTKEPVSGKEPVTTAYTTPEDVWGDWRGNERSDFTPTARQKMVMDSVQKALDSGLFYNDAVREFVAKDIGATEDQLNSNKSNVQGGDFGYDVYYARKAIEASGNNALEKQIHEELNLRAGDKLGTLIFNNDFKVNTNVVVKSVSEDGKSVELDGKRGAYTITVKANTAAVRYAIERAKERGKRKDTYEEFIAERNKPKTEREAKARRAAQKNTESDGAAAVNASGAYAADSSGIQNQQGADEENITPAPEKSKPKTEKEARARREAEKSKNDPISASDSHQGFVSRLNDGDMSVDEFKAHFEAVINGKNKILGELLKLTKDKMLARLGGYAAQRYKSEAKDKIAVYSYRQMLDDFVLGDSISYVMGAKYEDVIRNYVEGYGQKSLDDYAKTVKERRDARSKEADQKRAGMNNPQTIDDFVALIRSKMADGMTSDQARRSLTEEQRKAYDDLVSEQTRKGREQQKESQATAVQATAQTTSGQIIPAKHTKTGEDLFVVKTADRVERDVYNQWNATAKKLGGRYSSFRGAGAVPGFQFKTNEAAEVFLKYLGGDTVAAKDAVTASRDAYADDKSQTAVERLQDMADRLEERADVSLNRDRKANTERRARFAVAAESAARTDIALAKTMRNIAGAIKDGSAKLLDRLRQKAQVELLSSAVRTAQSVELRDKYSSYQDQESHRSDKPTMETADYAKWPTYTAFRSDLAGLARQLLQIDGAKKLGQRLLKVADDITDAYQKFAKENLNKVSTFTTKDGAPAIFSTAEKAEEAIRRSGFNGKATTISFKRGEHMVIMGPEMAKEAGFWQGDDDKRITLNQEFGRELVQKAKETGGRNGVSLPWVFANTDRELAQWKALGIETPFEMRAALREFIGLQERPAQADKVKELERKMIGRKNDGLDFFPTPAATAQEMIDTAGIQEGMSVLEPSAGWGHIAEQIRDVSGVAPEVIEMSSDRRELLEAKGFNVVGSDFMEATGKYDRIVMNPPFSDRRDAEHVQHAYTLLNPGGRIVSIMGEGVFFGQDNKAKAFREWLDSVSGTSEKLAEGTFNDSSLPVNTGVNARMVVIDKSERHGGATMFSRGRQGGSMAARDLKAVVDRARSSLKNLPVVHALKSPENLDQSNPSQKRLYEHINEAGALNDVEGATHDGEIYLFADNMADEFRAEHVLVNHEVGHYGLREVFGRTGLDPILNTIYMSNASVRREADALRDRLGLKSNVDAVEEVIVDIPPKKLIKLNAWRRLVRYIRDWMDSHGFTGLAGRLNALLKSGLDDQQKADMLVADVVNAAREWVRNGTPSQSTAVSETKLSVFEYDAYDKKSFGLAVDRIASMKDAPRTSVTMGDTPDVLVAAGAKPLQIQMSAGIIHKAAGRLHKQHAVPIEVIRNLPSLISDPVMVFDSSTENNALVILVDAGDENGKPVLVAMHLDTNGSGFHSVNKIASVYGKDGTGSVQQWMQGNLRYYNKEKASSWLHAVGLQLPEANTIKRLNPTVVTENDVVKQSDVKFSRKPINQVVRGFQGNAIQFFGNQSLKTFNWVNRFINTQFHKALKDKDFGRVYNLIQGMQNHVATAASRPAELAPGILHRVDNVFVAIKTLVSSSQRARVDKVGEALFAGTLEGASVTDGKVWSDQELRSTFGMDDTGVALYKQARAAIDASLDELAAGEAFAVAQNYLPKALRGDIIESPEDAQSMIAAALGRQIDTAIRANLDGESLKSMQDALATVHGIFDQSEKLKNAGYAPLMRFGKYDLKVMAIDPATGNVQRDEDDKPVTLFYGRYETQAKARAAEKEQADLYAGRDVQIIPGVVNESANELYRGVNPEILSIFAEAIGTREAMDDYIRLVRSERSAMKRKLERKGTPGYSTDIQRVMANFLTSNARQAAQQLYGTAVNQAIRRVPKEKGDVQKEALALRDYVIDPNDKGAFGSSLMFAWFLGGSPAAAVVNMTQPVMMTLPYLSQYGAARASAAMAKAVPYAMGRKQIADGDLRAALKKASLEGIVDAQEVFHLYSIGSRQLSAGPKSQALMTLWGSMFSAVEGLNRRLTFIAAWDIAKAQGETDPYQFAVNAVNQTQGIYNKANRPNAARSTVGRAVFTFKTYSIMYVELMNRMWKSGPEGKKAVLLMMAVLILASGTEGLPGAKALDDIIDTIGQWMGYDTNMKRWKRRHAYELLGKVAGDLVLYGASSLTPLDFGGRLGLGNIIPATDILKPSAGVGNSRAIGEIIGPTAGAAQQIGDSLEALSEGNKTQAAINLAPKAIRDVASAARMASRGYATDAIGRKTVETTRTDAAIKGIGFNPTVVADRTRVSMPIQQDIALAKKTETSIVHAWAQAIVDGDQGEAKAQAERLAEWNKDNPDSFIRINPSQIRDKVRQLTTEKSTRITKSAPKEIRGRIGLELMK